MTTTARRTTAPSRPRWRTRWRSTAQSFLEKVAETDDALIEKYLGGEEITVEELKAAIRKATIACQLVPVVCGTSYKNKGVQMLLDAIVDYMPSRWTSRRPWAPSRAPMKNSSAMPATKSRLQRWRSRS